MEFEMDEHFYRPEEGHGLVRDPFSAIVAPRPIGWISTRSIDGVRNLAPYSFFNAFNYRPPIIGFASVGWKDTLANVAATGEFGWSLVTRDLANAMNLTSASVDAGADEFELAGLPPAESRVIGVPRVAGALVSFECVRTDVVRLRARTGEEVETWLVLGEVVGVHIASALIVGGAFEEQALRPVLRAGGAAGYVEVSPESRFSMRRPA